MLDYLWAGLPVVATRGDALGDLVEREGLGRTVRPGDVDGFAAACRELLDDAGAPGAPPASGSPTLRPALRWERGRRAR